MHREAVRVCLTQTAEDRIKAPVSDAVMMIKQVCDSLVM